jgi:tripartite-type tricarboxylate transporter receptor subunit TctC
MRVSLGQAVLVENIAGASGTIGTGRVARSAPDGYTLVLGNLATHVFSGAASKPKYNVQKDFTPLSLIATQSFVIVGKQTLPANNLKELLAWLKANPDKAIQGTGGPEGVPHLMGVLFQRRTGTRFGLVPYRGTAVAINDLVAGHIDLMIDTANNTLPQIRAGTIKAFAVTTSNRLPVAPDIPTVDEAGLPDFHYSSWQALFAPANLPEGIVVKLHSAVIETLNDPAVRRRLGDLGQDIVASDRQTPEALTAFQQTEIARWWPVIKATAN